MRQFKGSKESAVVELTENSVKVLTWYEYLLKESRKNGIVIMGSKEEASANAELFTDALRTAQQMGDKFMLPSELLEENKRLKEEVLKLSDIEGDRNVLNERLIKERETRSFALSKKDQQIAELREALKELLIQIKCVAGGVQYNTMEAESAINNSVTNQN